QEFAMHYQVGVVPARPGHPKDKAKVEVGVQVVERWILAALRHQKFFRLADLNHAIRELLERLNQRPFRKREGSRASSSDTDDHRDLSPGIAGSLARPWSWTRTGVHAERTPAEESPSASRVDALTHGALGRTDRTAHGRVV